MPTEQLKALGDADAIGAYSEALTRLFGLGQPPASGTDADRSPERKDRSDRRVEPFRRPGTRS